MPDLVDHVVLTRFNLPSGGIEDRVRAQDGWLHERMELFESYCLPSISAQDQPPDGWIIYFDRRSPAWLRQKVDDYAERGAFHPRFVDAVTPGEILRDIRAVLGRTRSFLLTTNLDNDDGLAFDFSARLRSLRPAAQPQAVYVSRGLVLRQDSLYEVTDHRNAFCSVLESWETAQTCWVDWHTLLPHRMATRRIGGTAAWLQVVHGTNVSNRVRGRRVSARQFRGRFVGLDHLTDPTWAEFLFDRALGSPARTLRRIVRTIGRETILRIGGKSALERAKLAFAKSASDRADSPR